MKYGKILGIIISLGLSVNQIWSATDLTLHGYGWVQAGMLMQMTDSLDYNYNKNWMQSAATQVTATVALSENLEGSLGIGGGQDHPMQGNASSARGVHIRFATYITQASFKWFSGDKADPNYSLTVGHFPYIYNTNVKNLGLYLLRGPVYPGALVSGFEAKETLPIANFLGTHFHAKTGSVSHDILFTSETDFRPYFDFSLAYIAQHQIGETFKYGAGVNFYHLIPVYDRATNPKDPNLYDFEDSTEIKVPTDRSYFYVDPTVDLNRFVMIPDPNDSTLQIKHYLLDTTWYSHQGTKLTAFFSLDTKKILGLQGMNANDLIIYGEAALIGVKNYKGVYENRLDRIPIMMGINLPTFGLLDNLSFEVEYYKSPYKNDVNKLQTLLSPIPISNATTGYEPMTFLPGDTLNGVVLNDTVQVVKRGSKVYSNLLWDDPYDQTNLHKDDWKWSLHAAKTVFGHIRFSGQVANDHFRPSGIDSEFGLSSTYFTPFSTIKDWYWMSKVTYFF